MQHGSHDQQSADRRIIAGLTAFLTKHGKAMVVFLIVAGVGIVALFVALSIRNSRVETSLEAVEQLQSDYYDWQSLDSAGQEDGYADLHAQAEAISQSYPRLYAASRALLVDAEALFALERFDDAAQRYVELADRFPKTYLAPLGLMGAAVASENSGNIDLALDYLNRIVDNYADTSSDVPRALFSIGRIHETQDNIVDAERYYNQLIQDYPTSTWTDLARTRIISLTAQGRIGGT